MRLAAALACLLVSPARSETLLVRRSGEAPPAARDWHAALDAVFSEADALWARAAAAGPAPSAADAADAAARLGALGEALAKVTGSAADAEGARALAGRLASRPEQLADLEAPSAFRFAGAARERALEARGPAAAPNALLSEDGASWELPFLAVDGVPSGGRPSPVLASLAAAVRAGGKPAQAAASRRRAWLRADGVEVLLDMGAPPGAPAVRVRAQTPGPGSLAQAASYFLARALFECGFAVTVDAGTLRAAFGAERGAGPEERAERFAAAWGAASASRQLPELLRGYLDDTLTRRETEERVEALARTFAAEGSLPVDGTGPGALARGMAAWRARAGARQTLRARMDAALVGLGLAPFPAGVAVGQRTLDIHYNEPVAAALARGELRRRGGRLERDPSWNPAAGAASAPSVPEAWRGRLGPALAWSLPASASGPRVDRGQWRLGPDEWLVVVVQRGPDGRPARLAGWSATSAGRRTALAPERVASELDALGLVSAVPLPAPGAVPPTALAGLPLARGGPVEASVTFDPARASEGGLVFVTPYLSPTDRAAARKAKGLVATAGGPAAAVWAARAGLPAVELPRASWSEGAGLAVEVWGRAGFRRVLVREGDRVRLDGGRGVLELLP